MSVSRRSFLTGLFSTATLAVALPHFATPALAQTYVDKIKQVEILVNALLEKHRTYSFISERGKPMNHHLYESHMGDTGVDLMSFLVINFKRIEIDDRTKQAFLQLENRGGEIDFRSIPPETIEEFIPFVVLRELFTIHKVRPAPLFSNKASSYFDIFAKSFVPLLDYERSLNV